MKVDWKKVRERAREAHFQMQRVLAASLSVFAGFMAVLMLVPAGAGDYGYDSPEPVKWVWKAAGCLVIGIIAGLMHWRLMKRRYPDYPHHKKDDGYPPIY